MSVLELVLILMELKKWVESTIKSYKKNLKKDFEESDYRVLPDKMSLAATCFRTLKDYRIFIEEELKEED